MGRSEIVAGGRRLLAVPAVELALVALLYWAGGELGLRLALVHGQVTPIWPPTGIATVALWYGGWRLAAGVAAGALVVNLPLGPDLPSILGITVSNTLAPMAAVKLLRLAGFHPQFDRIRDAVILVMSALLGMTVSASLGSLMLWFQGLAHPGGFAATWAVWWTGDAMGVLLFAPLLFGFIPSNLGALRTPKQIAEFILMLMIAGGITIVAFNTEFRIIDIVFPWVILMAWRFRQLGAAGASVVASVVASVLAVSEQGGFANLSLPAKMFTLQAFNATLAITSFLFAAALSSRERERNFSVLYSAAQLASESKTRFLNMAAHELRTPLTVVRGYLSMMADGTLGEAPPSWKEPIQIMDSKAEELNELVNNLLDAARIEGDRVALHLQDVDVRILLEEAAARVAPRAALIGATVKTELSDAETRIHADPQHMGRILDNLLNNALSYSDHPPLVELKLKPGAGEATITIKDDGVGIPEEWHERIFERFSRIDDASVPGAPGTGLGLYIARELAIAQGGTLVLAQSAVGQGSTFVLSFPLVNASAEPA